MFVSVTVVQGTFLLTKLFCWKFRSFPCQSTLPKKMVTGTFAHNSWGNKNLKMHKKVIKPSNLAYTMLLVQ